MKNKMSVVVTLFIIFLGGFSEKDLHSVTDVPLRTVPLCVLILDGAIRFLQGDQPPTSPLPNFFNIAFFSISIIQFGRSVNRSFSKNNGTKSGLSAPRTCPLRMANRQQNLAGALAAFDPTMRLDRFFERKFFPIFIFKHPSAKYVRT